MLRLDVGVAGVARVGRRVRQDDAFPRAPRVVDDALRQPGKVGEALRARRHRAGRFHGAERVDPRLAVALEQQGALLGPRVLQREPEQRPQQGLELDLAGDGPRGLHHAGQVQRGGRRAGRLAREGPRLPEQVAVRRIERSGLGGGAPLEVRGSRLAEIRGGDPGLTAREPESPKQLACQRALAGADRCLAATSAASYRSIASAGRPRTRASSAVTIR